MSPPSEARHTRRSAPRLLGLACAVMALFAVVMWGLIVIMQVDRLRGELIQGNRLQDYMAFYAAGQLVREGRPGAIYDLDAIAEVQSGLLGVSIQGEDRLPYLNPPYVAALFAPLTALTMSQASALLFAANVALFLLCAVLLQRLVATRPPAERAFAGLAFASSFTVFTVFLQLQFSLLALAAWLGFACFQLRDKQVASGAFLLLGLFKPQLVLLPVLFLIFRRRFRALAPLAAAGVALAAVSVAVSGPGVVVDYPRFLIESTTWEGQGIYADGMYGWNAFVADLTGDRTPSSLLVAPLVLVTFALLFHAWWASRHAAGPALLPVVGLTATAAMLTNLHLYLHDIVLLAVPLAAAAAHALRTAGAPSASPPPASAPSSLPLSSGRGQGEGIPYAPIAHQPPSDSPTPRTPAATPYAWAFVVVAFWFLVLPLPGLQTLAGGPPSFTLALAALYAYAYSETVREAHTESARPGAAQLRAAA